MSLTNSVAVCLSRINVQIITQNLGSCAVLRVALLEEPLSSWDVKPPTCLVTSVCCPHSWKLEGNLLPAFFSR